MKSKTCLALAAALAVPAGLVWYEAKGKTQIPSAAPSTTPPALIATQTPVINSEPVSTPQQAPIADRVVDTVGADGVLKHVAQPGETVTSLAQNLLGQDTKSNRDSIINANSSLRTNPDKLLAGKSYKIPASAVVPVSVPSLNQETPTALPPPEKTATAAGDSSTELKYTAAHGDTVQKLAGAFLGNDDQAHQDAITDANPSLQNNPDRLIAGKTYRIPAPSGLTAAPAVSARRPSTQPDADQIIASSTPRLLKYTASAGDNVTTLAVKLLGSDTQEARDTIINNNPDLKRDPDHLVAGQTYSIPAPMAAAANP